MSVSYKRLLHMMIEKDISNQDLMRDANISNGQYMALDKVENICMALDCRPNDILEFIPEEKDNE